MQPYFPGSRPMPVAAKNAAREVTTTDAPTGRLSRYEPISPTQKHTTERQPAKITTPKKLFFSRMAVRAGKITRLEMSMAPMSRIPSTMVRAVRMASRVLQASTFNPVAREKLSSKVTA